MEALPTTSMIRKSRSECSPSVSKPAHSISRAIIASSVTLTVDLGSMSQSLLQAPHLDKRSQTDIAFPITMPKSQLPDEFLTLPEALNPSSRLRSSSFSKIGSDNTVSKTGLTTSKSFSFVSKTISKGRDRLLRRKSFLDANPPHCQQKAFKDGTTVQMIGGLMPPRLPFSAVNTGSVSSTITTYPHAETEINNSVSIAVRSISCASLVVMISSPNPVIDDDLDERISNRPSDSIEHIEEIESYLSRKYSKHLQVDDSRLTISTPPTKLYGPRISASIMPQLDPIALSDLISGSGDQPVDSRGSDRNFASSDRPESGVHKSESNTTLGSVAASTASGLLRTSGLENVFDEGDHTPSMTASADTSDTEEGDKTVTQVVTTGDFSFVSARMGTALKNFITDMSRGSMDAVSERSILANEVTDTESRWDDAVVAESTSKQSSLSQRHPSNMVIRPISSSSILGPLTEADFDASFEAIFRVSNDRKLDFATLSSCPMERTNATSGYIGSM